MNINAFANSPPGQQQQQEELMTVKEAMGVLWIKETEESVPEQVTVNKLLLAASSPFFYTLFFGPFQERETDHFQLVQPKIVALKNLFAVLDGDCSITTDNVADLIALSNEYLIGSLYKKCIAFIKTLDAEKNLIFKFRMADQYGLKEIENQCLSKFVGKYEYCKLINDTKKYITDYSDLSAKIGREKGHFGVLSDRLKARMLHKLLNIG